MTGRSSVHRGDRRQMVWKTASFIRGFTAGFFTPVARAKGHFLDPRKKAAQRRRPYVKDENSPDMRKPGETRDS